MTVKEFLQDNESSIGSSGGKWDSCDALKQLNRTRNLFYGLGTWDGLTTYACISSCSKGRLITPWFASKIDEAYTCNRKVTIATGGYFALVDRSYCGRRLRVEDTQTYSSTPIPIEESCKGLLVESQDILDAGKTISISYLNKRGSVVSDEIQLTETFKKFKTSSTIKSIISINKPVTSGEIHFFSRDDNKHLFSLSPYENSPRYRVYCINGNECSNCCGETFVLKMRRRYLPFSEVHYEHHIDLNPHALAIGMQAMSAFDERTSEGLNRYTSLVRSAVDLLKKEKLEQGSFESDTETTTMNYALPVSPFFCAHY